jgi:hypothetical protein
MGTDYDIVNGVIKISEEALQKAKEAQLLELERAQAYKIYARQEAKNAALK